MLPPIAPSVLDSNPKFKALYTNLAGSRLNADASTRLIKQQRAQADIEKVLASPGYRKRSLSGPLVDQSADVGLIAIDHGEKGSGAKDTAPRCFASCGFADE